MAIYGIGAHYSGTDMTQDFVNHACACIGWNITQSPALHNYISSLKIGDIMYIKSFPPSIGLIVKAVGIVTDNQAQNFTNLGYGIKVKWIWEGNETIGFSDKYNVHSNTLYEEFVPTVQNFVISKF